MNTNYTTTPTASGAPMSFDFLSDDAYRYHDTTNRSATTSASVTPTASAPPTVVTPTANAVYLPFSPTVANFPSSSAHTVVTLSNTGTGSTTATTDLSNRNDDKVVMIPSNNVFIEQQSLPNQATASNTNHATAPVYSYHNTEYTDYYRNEETSTSASGHGDNYYYNNANDSDAPVATLHDPDQSQRYFNGKPVKPKHAHLPDSVLAFKAERKRRTVMATCTGGAVGLIALGPVLGPVGAVIGATSAYAAAKTVGKHRERKLTEHAILQQNYLSSSIRHDDDDDNNNAVDEHNTGAPPPSSSSSSSSGFGSMRSSMGGHPCTGSSSRIEIPIDRAELA